jgi:hypothetical protein
MSDFGGFQLDLRGDSHYSFEELSGTEALI